MHSPQVKTKALVLITKYMKAGPPPFQNHSCSKISD